MNELGLTINRRLRELGVTQREIAQRAGVSHVLISKLISGKVKTTGRLPEIAAALGWTVDEMMKEVSGGPYGSRAERNGSSAIVQPVEPWDSSTPLGSDELELPLFREIELSAGSGRTFVQENHGAKLRFARSTLARKGIDPSNAACCFVSGDSMEPVMPSGSTVAIDISQKSIVDGKMYAIDHGGLLRVKYLYRLPGGGVRVRSANRDEYPDEDLVNEDLKDFRIIGRVFWYAVLL